MLKLYEIELYSSAYSLRIRFTVKEFEIKKETKNGYIDIKKGFHSKSKLGRTMFLSLDDMQKAIYKAINNIKIIKKEVKGEQRDEEISIHSANS
jgi:hypothetical protein